MTRTFIPVAPATLAAMLLGTAIGCGFGEAPPVAEVRAAVDPGPPEPAEIARRVERNINAAKTDLGELAADSEFNDTPRAILVHAVCEAHGIDEELFRAAAGGDELDGIRESLKRIERRLGTAHSGRAQEAAEEVEVLDGEAVDEDSALEIDPAATSGVEVEPAHTDPVEDVSAEPSHRSGENRTVPDVPDVDAEVVEELREVSEAGSDSVGPEPAEVPDVEVNPDVVSEDSGDAPEPGAAVEEEPAEEAIAPAVEEGDDGERA